MSQCLIIHYLLSHLPGVVQLNVSALFLISQEPNPVPLGLNVGANSLCWFSIGEAAEDFSYKQNPPTGFAKIT